jgi:hypothetical protein
VITLQDAVLDEKLNQVLHAGCIALDGIRVVYDWLPGRAICSATLVDGTMWLVVDLDKPSAHRHALAMLQDAARSEAVLESVEPLTLRATLALVS